MVELVQSLLAAKVPTVLGEVYDAKGASATRVEPSNGIRSSCQTAMVTARIAISTGSG